MNIIILGPQGSGKGTQAKLLAQKLKIKHISTGELLRKAAQAPTPKAKIIKNLLKKGTLIPFETTLGVLEPVLKKITSDFILDGMPRDLRQAEHLDWILKKINQKINQVIFITLSKKSSYARLLKRAKIEGRSDDTQEAIKKRLEVYHKETRPVIAYYQKQGLVMKINGEPDINTIHQDILKKISHRTALAA